MNKNLENAIFDIAETDALMFAFEAAYLDLDVADGEHDRMDRGAYAFYAIWDSIRKVADELDRVAGDCKVVDAIYAAEQARKSKKN